jgi:hypothetical protein
MLWLSRMVLRIIRRLRLERRLVLSVLIRLVAVTGPSSSSSGRTGRPLVDLLARDQRRSLSLSLSSLLSVVGAPLVAHLPRLRLGRYRRMLSVVLRGGGSC